ncbi:MAG: anthranilate synthase component I [Lachnoclostridium sp.]|jgi:anthranilate synthase component 1|nr:anthranilate synthase component I [Lachnoclostridium sp.]
MIRPSLSEAGQIDASQYKMIPISMEMYADLITPIEVLKRLKNISKHCFMLESAEDSKKWGRYTFLGFDPTTGITCLDGFVKIQSGSKSTIQQEGNPNTEIGKILDQCKSIKFDYLPPFTGGLVGYFSYDYAKYTEPKLNLNAIDEEYFNDVDLMLFDKVIAFDHYCQKIFLIVNIRTDNLENEYRDGAAKLESMKELIQSGVSGKIEAVNLKTEIRALFTEEEYCQMVVKAKEHIKEGDIFQVVLSNRWEAEFEGSLFDTYRVLRTINPSPYMFYFGGSDLEIAGASPETLVKLHDGKLFTFPLAGTRPRGITDQEDIQREKELLADEKELSEHNMLVDLGRNDLGKISKFGSIEVEKYMSILRFSHVMHIGSTVSGEICEGKTGLDAINAVLPAGTLSGAPKIRAMQIINELENTKRGIYGGAVGYLDFTGNMDTCIAIRIAYKRGKKVFIRSGAGIVADSNPKSEYRECMNKAAAVITALKQSAGGIDR